MWAAVRYLVSLSEAEASLIRTHSKWILLADPEAGLEAFLQVGTPATCQGPGSSEVRSASGVKVMSLLQASDGSAGFSGSGRLSAVQRGTAWLLENSEVWNNNTTGWQP